MLPIFEACTEPAFPRLAPFPHIEVGAGFRINVPSRAPIASIDAALPIRHLAQIRLALGEGFVVTPSAVNTEGCRFLAPFKRGPVQAAINAAGATDHVDSFTSFSVILCGTFCILCPCA